MKAKQFFVLLVGLLLFSAAASAQTKDVHGVVVDSNNASVPGATVMVKGDQVRGTITGLDGAFTISAKAGETLVVSCIGYSDAQYTVGSSDQKVVIVITESSEILDDLVVVGYGVQKKSVMTSSVSRVTGDALDEGHPTNVQNALKGKLSGVYVVSNSGQPGADSKIRIRGTSSTNDSDPLYIIDGMPSEEGINHLNPSDIESIEVLKDAASAAIYGARGANGVILVTTKEGRDGKSTISYDFTYGIQNPSNKVKLLNGEQYQELLNEQAVNTGLNPYFTTKSGVNTDWQEVLRHKNAPIMNHRLSVSGGNKSSNYYVSFGYIDQQGIYAKGFSDYDRYNVRAKYNNTILESSSRNWLNKITLGINAYYSNAKTTGADIGNDEGGGLIASMNMLPPTEAVYQTDAAMLAQYEINYPNRVLSPDGQVYNIIEMREVCNPLASMQARNNQRRIGQNFGGNAAVTVNVLPGLVYKTTFSYSVGLSSNKSIMGAYDLNATTKNTQSEVHDRKSDSRHMQWENTLTYSKTFGKHTVGGVLGTSMSSYHSSWIDATDYEVAIIDIDKAYISSATAPEESSKVSGSAYDHRLGSVFGRINYNYDEKYLFEVVARRDGSSNFAKGNKFAWFPSVSAGWVFTREGFMKPANNWFSFGKLRASWGQNGNERIGAFKYTTSMTKGHDAVVGGKVQTGMLPGGYSNENLKWETSEQIDLGLDLRFFHDALTFTADYFNKTTKDMLMEKSIPMYTSYYSMTVNGGTVKNSGIELEASYRFSIKDVNFAIGANASKVKNVVVDNGGGLIALNTLGGGMGNHVSYSENGKPFGYFYGYIADGVFQNEAEIKASAQPDAVPGDIRYRDVSGEDGKPDGKIDDHDQTMIGDPNPDWIFGFNLAIEWKGLDFSAFFQGTQGNDMYKVYRRPNVTLANYGAEWLDRWHGEGTSNKYPRLVAGETYKVSSLYVEDASYLRFKTCQLGYTLPENILKRAGIASLRFFLQGENLFTITKYSGYDPEVGTRYGVDAGTYPQARTFTVGASIRF